MNLNIYVAYIIINIIENIDVNGKEKLNDTNNEIGDHIMVTNSDVFTYVVAVLKKSTYLSAGALLNDNWVLTAADSLFLLRESARILRIRLGSINYKKGGVVLPIKYFEVHPLYNDSKPEYDVALIKLSKPVRFTSHLYPIRLQKRPKAIVATHFIVTAWLIPTPSESNEHHHLQSMEVIKRRRILSVSHLHPTETGNCTDELEAMDIHSNETLMCLDPASGSDPCMRDIGAPVVLNGVLWGVMSSWRPDDCDLDTGPTFVSLVSARNISDWMHAVMHERTPKFSNWFFIRNTD